MVGKNIDGSNKEIDKVISTFVKEYVKKYKPSAKAQHKVLAHAQDNDRLDDLKKKFDDMGKTITKDGNKFVISDKVTPKNDDKKDDKKVDKKHGDTQLPNGRIYNENDFRQLALVELPGALVHTYFQQNGYINRWRAQFMYNMARLSENRMLLGVLGMMFTNGLVGLSSWTPEFVDRFIQPMRWAVGIASTITVLDGMIRGTTPGSIIHTYIADMREIFATQQDEDDATIPSTDEKKDDDKKEKEEVEDKKPEDPQPDTQPQVNSPLILPPSQQQTTTNDNTIPSARDVFGENALTL